MVKADKQGNNEPLAQALDNGSSSTEVKSIELPHTLSVRQLAKSLNVGVVDVIKQLMKIGIMANIN
ncbi:MAG: translation initiation factor IF-2 N-terminal domain-containing protein, partial [Dehalococcoidales bacterium]|nr:translation initiation factor IF-2 N-terminal domain-containing protein [Dehalococcoidales bacterium]